MEYARRNHGDVVAGFRMSPILEWSRLWSRLVRYPTSFQVSRRGGAAELPTPILGQMAAVLLRDKFPNHRGAYLLVYPFQCLSSLRRGAVQL